MILVDIILSSGITYYPSSKDIFKNFKDSKEIYMFFSVKKLKSGKKMKKSENSFKMCHFSNISLTFMNETLT